MMFREALLRDGFKGKNLIMAHYLTDHFCRRHLFLFSTTTFEQNSSRHLFDGGDDGGNLLADYLIDSWGFNSRNAEAISSVFPTLRNLNKPRSVLNYLKQSGFKAAQIERMATWKPRLLVSKVDQTLKPKLQVFQDLGFSDNEIVKLITTNPLLLFRNFQPSVNFLKTKFCKKEEIVKIVRRCRCHLSRNLFKEMPCCISVLEKHGVSNRAICKLIERNPPVLLQKPEWLVRHVRKVIEMGVDPSSTMFAHVLGLLCGLSEDNLNAKVQIFKSFGWSEDDLARLLRSYPFCFSVSESRIEKKLDFFMNQCKYDSCYLLSYPNLLGLSLEARIIPRYKFCEALNCKEVRKRNICFSSAARLTERDFRNRYVFRYKDLAPEVCEAYLRSTGAVEILSEDKGQ